MSTTKSLVGEYFKHLERRIGDPVVINAIEVIDEDAIKGFIKVYKDTVGTSDPGLLELTDESKGTTFLINYIDEAHAHVVELKEHVEPPPWGEVLLHLCARTKRQQAALGDLNETFNRNYAQWGRARATRLYWAEVMRSVGPLIVRVLGRLVKWGAIVDVIKRHFLS